jgi:HK97 family phage prohead protease
MDNTLNTNQAVAGYACYFNIVDDNNDIILPTAFQSLPNTRYPPNDATVKFLYQHDVTRPIGKWTLLKADSVGLYVEGILNLDLPDGLSASIMTKNQIIDGLSIGYKPVSSYTDLSGRRVLDNIVLYEISLVTFPCQKNARLYDTSVF